MRTWTQEKGTPYISDVFTVLVVCTVEALRQSIYVKFDQFKKWNIEAVALGNVRLIYFFKFFLPFVPNVSFLKVPVHIPVLVHLIKVENRANIQNFDYF